MRKRFPGLDPDLAFSIPYTGFLDRLLELLGPLRDALEYDVED